MFHLSLESLIASRIATTALIRIEHPECNL